MAIDHVLKLYAETIQSPYLHYGFWDKPQLIDPAKLRLDDIIEAQERYIEHLSGFIPDDVRLILDVGCGIGGNAGYLIDRGYTVETLSPDTYQEEAIHRRFNASVPFYRTKFEKFSSPKQYDLILESESACYIKMGPGFEKAYEVLRPGGYLLVADYFVHHNDGSQNPHLKASHNMDEYLRRAKENRFTLIREYDQTENTMPTLDAARVFVQRFMEPTVEYALNSLRRKTPKLLTFVKMLFGKRIRKKSAQLVLIDSAAFRKYRRYMIYLFQKD